MSVYKGLIELRLHNDAYLSKIKENEERIRQYRGVWSEFFNRKIIASLRADNAALRGEIETNERVINERWGFKDNKLS